MTTFKRLLYRTFGFLPLLLILWANAHWAEAIDSKSALFIDFPRLALLVKEQYVDPARISPDAMFASILESLEQHINRLVITLPKSLNEALEKSKKSENSLRPGEVRQSEKPQKKEEIILDMGGVKKIIPYEHLRSIWGMIFALKDVFNFVEMQAQKQGLLEKSINGEAPLDLQKINWDNFNSMLATLDPHSNFLGPVFARDITAATKGEFGGVGIVISVRDGFLTVISPIDGTPAAIAGVKSKDRIVKIEEESAVNLPLDKAVGMLRGAPNSTVKITVQRILPAGPKEFEFKLKRANIKIESVAYTLLDNNIGYLRIKAFQGNTAEDVKKAIIDMKTKSANKMSGIILDLRDNPGGLLREAVTIADYFLSSGEIVSTQGAQKESRQVEMATGGELDPKLKVAVLINGGSASASEIVAGAIKYGGPNANDPEAGRGILIGDSSSFGKGSVQMLFDFPSAAPKTKNEEPIEPGALKLTIAQYYGPGDRPIQANGIWPDIWYKLFNAKEPNIVRQEKDLDAHLVAASAPEEKPFTELVMLAPASKDEESEYSSKLDAAKLRKDPAIQIAMPIISSPVGGKNGMFLLLSRFSGLGPGRFARIAN